MNTSIVRQGCATPASFVKYVQNYRQTSQRCLKKNLNASRRGAVKPTAVDDDVGGLCRRACREHCHGLRGLVEPHRHAPGRCLAALHLWPGHGYRRHFRPSFWSPRSVPGLPPVHQGHCLPLSKTFSFQNRKLREGQSGLDDCCCLSHIN